MNLPFFWVDTRPRWCPTERTEEHCDATTFLHLMTNFFELHSFARPLDVSVFPYAHVSSDGVRYFGCRAVSAVCDDHVPLAVPRLPSIFCSSLSSIGWILNWIVRYADHRDPQLCAHWPTIHQTENI